MSPSDETPDPDETVIQNSSVSEPDGDQTEIFDPEIHPVVSGSTADPESALMRDSGGAVQRDAWSSSVSEDAHPEHTLMSPLADEGAGKATVILPVVLNHRGVSDASDGLDAAVAASAAHKDADYELQQTLGEGGRGVVHAARQKSMDRPVAIKVLKSRAARLESSRQAFISEAIITGGLDHPNIVPIYEVGKQSNDALFYAMKQVEGVEWKDRLPQLSLTENLDILLRVCDAVAFGHARFIIHRDLKPANVMLGSYGEVLVMDWGLAMPTSEHPQRSTFPDAQRGGTPHYMAPEMTGKPMSDVDHRCDVYLLGAILFEIITGKAPHVLDSPPANRREHVNACLAAVAENYIAPTDVTGDLMHIARKALSTDPADRYQQVTDFQSALRKYLAHLESIDLTERAVERFKSAQDTGAYDEFSRARFGFEAALEEWPENPRAATFLKSTTLTYAQTAFERDDLDLALSLLDTSEKDHERLLSKIRKAVTERKFRTQRIRRLRRFGLVASLFIAALSTLAAMWINSERNNALDAQAATARQRNIAEDARLKAEQHAAEALRQQAIAENERQLAKNSEQKAKNSEQKALSAEAVARSESEKAKQLLVIADRNAYRSDMLLIQSGWATGQVRNVKTLLDQYRDREEFKGFEWYYWDSYRGNSTGLTKTFDHTPKMLFMPDGLTVVLNEKHTYYPKVLDIKNNTEKFTLEGHKSIVNCVSCNSDGTRLATASWDNTVKIRDAATGKVLRTLAGHTDGVNRVAFSPDGTRLASASRDQTVKLWQAGSDEAQFTLKGHNGQVVDTCFSPDGTRVASASWDKSIRVWDASTGELQWTLNGHTDITSAVAFSPDGTQLASASWDNTVKLWDPQTGQEQHTLRGHQDRTTCVAFNQTGSLLATGSDDSSVKVWNPHSGVEQFTLRGHTDRVYQVAFNPDGMQLLSTNHDNSIRVWNPDTRQEPLTIRGRLGEGQVAISPDSRSVAFTGTEGVRVWNTDSGLRTHLLRKRNPDGTAVSSWHVNSVSFSADGKRLATTDSDTVITWEMQSGRKILEQSSENGNVSLVCCSPDGKYQATGHQNGTIELRDLESGKITLTLKENKGPVYSLNFGPKGDLLACGTGNPDGHAIRVYDVITGKVTLTLQGHDHDVTDLSFAPDGRHLASASFDSTVAVWDLSNGKKAHTLTGHTDRLTSVMYSPDGDRLASGGWDNTVRIWDTGTAQVMLTLRGHTSGVTDVVFTPGGLRLVTASDDATVKIWDARPWTETMRIEKQALRLLKIKQSGAQSKEQLHKAIRAVNCIGLHPELQQQFKQKVISRAIEMADQYWRNITEQ
jgi:WD40 repeat protein/serine/threonine protein kinase